MNRSRLDRTLLRKVEEAREAVKYYETVRFWILSGLALSSSLVVGGLLNLTLGWLNDGVTVGFLLIGMFGTIGAITGYFVWRSYNWSENKSGYNYIRQATKGPYSTLRDAQEEYEDYILQDQL